MSAARQAAFEELKKEVGKFGGELGIIHEIIEKFQKEVEKLSASHKVHHDLATLEAIAGSLLRETVVADNLLEEIELVLDDRRETEKKVEELFDLLDESIKMLAGAEVLEKEISDSLGK